MAEYTPDSAKKSSKSAASSPANPSKTRETTGASETETPPAAPKTAKPKTTKPKTTPAPKTAAPKTATKPKTTKPKTVSTSTGADSSAAQGSQEFDGITIGGRKFGRTTIVAILVVLGVLAAPLGVAAKWAHGTITQQSSYMAVMSGLAQDSDVQNAVASEVTEFVMDRVNLSGMVEDAGGGLLGKLNDFVADLSGKDLVQRLEEKIRPALTDAVTGVVESDRFQTLWNQANTQAHTAVLAALNNETSNVAGLASNGDVTIDLNPIINQASSQVAGIAEIGSALEGVNTTIPLLKAEQVDSLRGYYSILTAFSTWAPIVAGIALIAALVLARKRLLVAALIGLAFIASTFLPQLLDWYVAAQQPAALSGDGLGPIVGRHLSDEVLAQMESTLGYGVPVGIGVLVVVAVVWGVGRVVAARVPKNA